MCEIYYYSYKRNFNNYKVNEIIDVKNIDALNGEIVITNVKKKIILLCISMKKQK
jgi:hypothetical protein